MSPRARAICAAAALAAASAFLCGNGYDRGYTGYGGGGYAGSGYQSGGAAGVDTIRVLSRDRRYPNNAAITAGYVRADSSYYTNLNKGSAGVAVRWGYNYNAAPGAAQFVTTANSDYRIRVQVTRPEDDFVWQSTTYNSFIWFKCTGLKPGMLVTSASLIFNVAAFTTPTIPANGFLAARLDTITADYAMLNSRTVGAAYSACNDTARFAVTFNAVDLDHSVAWSPTMANRDDRHDFGPRSNTIITAGSYATGQCLRLDITDAVQQACDNAVRDQSILTRGLLFAVYGSTTGTEATFDISAGNYAGVGSSGKGAPVFVAEGVTRRGAKPWAGVRVPIVPVFDDSYNMQTAFYQAMHDSGLTFDAAIFRDGMNGHPWADSLDATGATDINYLMHSRTHTSLGTLAGTQLDPELTRTWLAEQFTATKDTTTFIDFAWPAGGGTPNISLEAASRAIDYGYRSIRGTAVNWTAANTAVQHETWLSWNGYVNLCLVAAPSAGLIFEDGSNNEASAAQMADNLDDLIDQAVTDYGHAPVILYGHNYAIDHITGTNLRTFIGLVNARPHAGFMSYRRVLDLRLNGASFVAPAQIANWTADNTSTDVAHPATADSNMIQAMAADQDSAYSADSDQNYLQMWIAPK